MLLGNLSHLDHLLTVNQPREDWKSNIEKTSLLLRMHPHVIGAANRPRQYLHGCMRSPQVLLDALTDRLRSMIIDHKFEAGFDSTLTVIEVRTPDVEDGTQNLLRLVRADKHTEGLPDSRNGRQ